MFTDAQGQRYLDRIAYHGPTDPAFATLAALHRAHLMAVPFENLDIHIGRAITIGPAAIHRKLVDERRGGFCFELNGGFATLLRGLGFDVTILEARAKTEVWEAGQPFDHMTLLVTVDGVRYLADVGYGDNFITPLRFDDPTTQQGRYRIEHDGEAGRYFDGDELGFLFRTTPREVDDFSPGCTFHQTSPDSNFTKKRVCSLATPRGRKTLTGMTFKVRENGAVREHALAGPHAYAAVLRDQFGVVLPAGFRL